MDFWNRGNSFSGGNNNGFGNNTGGNNNASGNNGEGGSGNANNGGNFNAGGNGGWESKINEYQNKPEQEIMSELMSKVTQMKGDGTFDIAEIEKFYSMSAAMMSQEQQQRLRMLIEMLKK